MSESESIQYVKKLTNNYMDDGMLNVYDRKTLSFLRLFLKKHYRHINVITINDNKKWLLIFNGSTDKRKEELLDKKVNESMKSCKILLRELDDIIDEENNRAIIEKLRECVECLYRQKYITEDDYEDHKFNLEDIDFNDEDEVSDIIDVEYEFVNNAYINPADEEELTPHIYHDKSEYGPKEDEYFLDESLSAGDITKFVSEHEQAAKEAENHFNKDISDIDEDDLISWLSEHEELYKDFKEKFSLVADSNEDILVDKTELIDWITKQGSGIVDNIEDQFGSNLSQIDLEDIIEFISTDSVLWDNFKHRFDKKDIEDMSHLNIDYNKHDLGESLSESLEKLLKRKLRQVKRLQ